MINEVAVVLLFSLFGWKTALVYVTTGLFIAVTAGWIIGRLKLERWVEPWVYEMKGGPSSLEDGKILLSDRVASGRIAVKRDRRKSMALCCRRNRCRGGRPWLCPREFHGLDYGEIRLVVGALVRPDRRPALFERGRHHSHRPGAAGERRVARHGPWLS
ncbi:MAG: permease [Marinilabiliales bacterium]|nr:permease [Marinilabiliales bacterium]